MSSAAASRRVFDRSSHVGGTALPLSQDAFPSATAKFPKTFGDLLLLPAVVNALVANVAQTDARKRATAAALGVVLIFRCDLQRFKAKISNALVQEIESTEQRRRWRLIESSESVLSRFSGHFQESGFSILKN